MPDRSNDYQLPSWPPTKIDRSLWNAVMADLAARLTAREALEATFEVLQEQGVQAALDYIQVSVAPQLSALQQAIHNAQAVIDDILAGTAPNAAKLGGQLPAYYAKAADVGNLFQLVESKADADDVTAMIQQRIAALVDSSPATLDTLKELAAALGNDANFATTMANALATKALRSTKILSEGLVTGSGDLSANITLKVTPSTNEQALAGTDDTTAMTPLRTKEAIAAKVPLQFGNGQTYKRPNPLPVATTIRQNTSGRAIWINGVIGFSGNQSWFRVGNDGTTWIDYATGFNQQGGGGNYAVNVIIPNGGWYYCTSGSWGGYYTELS